MTSIIDGWYGAIVANTFMQKKTALQKAKRRYRLVEELMKSAKEDVVEARRQLRKWQRKAVVGRSHCCKLKAQMSVAAAPMSVATAPMSVADAVEVVPSDVESDSSQSTSSTSSASSCKVKKEVVAVQSRLKDEVAPMSVESPSSSSGAWLEGTDSSGEA